MINLNLGFTDAELEQIKNNLHKLPPALAQRAQEQIQELSKRKNAIHCKEDFLSFCKHVGPNLQIETEPRRFMLGPHHKVIGQALQDVADGKKRRICISIAPRFGKSLLTSYLFPAWYLGKFPSRRVIMASHTADLSTGFGRKVRDLIDDPLFHEIFPDVNLKSDSKAAGQWQLQNGGEAFCVGVGGALAGRGANLFILDDPFSEQDVMKGNTEIFEQAWNWHMTGPLQRLAPDGAYIIIQTRWHQLDLIGRVMNEVAKNEGSEEWEFIELPAILNEHTPEEKSLWPERWPLELLQQKRNIIDKQYWNAQYMQQPTSEGAALIKKDWWKHWEKADPPDVSYIIISLDAAQESHNKADFNAITVWGLFDREDEDGRKVQNVILLDAWRKRMEYPELKKAMFEEYERWEPDTMIIEKKSNGAALCQEMRRAGIPLNEYTPGKGQDKRARINSISDIFSSGMVWAPKDRRWAQEVIEEVQAFPNGAHDDYPDSVSLAMIRIRQGGLLRLPSDAYDPDAVNIRRKRAEYY